MKILKYGHAMLSKKQSTLRVRRSRIYDMNIKASGHRTYFSIVQEFWVLPSLDHAFTMLLSCLYHDFNYRCIPEILNRVELFLKSHFHFYGPIRYLLCMWGVVFPHTQQIFFISYYIISFLNLFVKLQRHEIQINLQKIFSLIVHCNTF